QPQGRAEHRYDNEHEESSRTCVTKSGEFLRLPLREKRPFSQKGELFLRKFLASWLHGFTDPLSSSGTNGFKRAVLRRLVSNEGGEFHFARDQIRCFKFSFEHQCPRVSPDVADHKFHRTRESDGVSFAPAPLCLRRLGGPPHIQLRVQQQENAFSRALLVKSQ